MDLINFYGTWYGEVFFFSFLIALFYYFLVYQPLKIHKVHSKEDET